MGLFNRLIWIFVSPSKVFADIREGKAAWWEGWIWVTITGVIGAYFLLPVSMIVIEINEHGLPIEQVDAQLDFVEKWGTLLLATTPVAVLVQSLVVFGLGYILVSILSPVANFKKFFAIGLYSSIVANCSVLLTALVVRMRGLDAILTPGDAEFSLGLSFMAPEEGVLLKSLCTSIEFFSIWALVLVAIGLMRVFDMSRKNAIICVVPLWLLFFLQRLMSVLFGGFG
jgi:hypothetical protein